MMFIKCPMDPDISFSKGHRKHPSHYTRDELPRLGYGWIHQGLSEDVVYPKSKLLAVSWPFSCGGLQSLISRHDVICTSEVSAPHFWPFKNMYIYIWYIYICSIVLCIYKHIHIPIHYFAGQSLFRLHHASVKLKDKSNNNMKTSWPTSHGINTWQPPIT